MTPEQRAALVEKVARALCDDDGNPCGCASACKVGKHYAVKAIDLIRAEVLEEAAKVADAGWNVGCTTYEVAAAIRALKGRE